MSGILQTLFLGAVATVKDAYFNLVTLLLNTTSTNGAQNNTFLDSSTNNFTITRNGNTTQGTFTPFSQTGWSNYMTTGYLTTAANAGFALSGDFTVECWVFSGDFSLDSSTRRRVFHTGGGDIASSLQLLLGTSGGNSAVISVLNNGFLIDGTINVVTNNWVHIAVARSGTALKLFVNGVQSGSTATTSQNFNSGTSNTVYIGANSSGNGIWQGYISNLRVIVGTAIYTSAFTPPTAPFATGTTNQQLLVCASNSFADINTATTAKTITVNSTPSVQAFSPFAPTTAYDTAVVGGSGYFDGSGDYLTWTGSTVGTAAYTFECWFYTPSFGSSQTLIGPNSTTNGGYGFNVASATSLSIDNYGIAANNFTVPTIAANAWHHVAVVRNGSGVTTVFLDGVRSSTGTITDTNNYGNVKSIGYTSSAVNRYFTGYISSPRYVTSAVYDPTQTTITVPTAPLTAVANTQLLLNYTNAGIYDSAAKNDLETVGNAQVSTTQAKWGTTSMYFDGSSTITTPSRQTLGLGSGNFTIECWVRLNATGTETTIGQSKNYYTAGYNGNFVFRVGTTNLWRSFDGQSNQVTLDGSYSWSTGVWYHVAWVRNGTTLTVYKDGTSLGSVTDTKTLNDSVNGLVLGSALNAYVDDLRITLGYARYTSNFSVPTAAFPIQ